MKTTVTGNTSARSYSSRGSPAQSSRSRASSSNSRPTQIEDYEQILQNAVTESGVVEITYVDRKGERTSRAIKPLKVFDYDYGEGMMRCVRAHCLLRNAERTFALFRIRSMTKL